MLMGEINSLSSQEPEFSEKEDDEWILVDFIGKMSVKSQLFLEASSLAETLPKQNQSGLEHRGSSKQMYQNMLYKLIRKMMSGLLA